MRCKYNNVAHSQFFPGYGSFGNYTFKIKKTLNGSCSIERVEDNTERIIIYKEKLLK